MSPALFVHMAAYGTCLAGKGRINRQHGAAVLFCLVSKFLLKVIISPAHLCVPVLYPDTFGGSPDAGKVFQHKERTLGVTADECLRDTMVHIVHPTVFSLPDGTDPSSCGRCPPHLEPAAQLFIVGPLLLHLCAGMESGLSSVICGRKETDPAVNANNPGMAGGIRRVRNFDSYRHMEKELDGERTCHA